MVMEYDALGLLIVLIPFDDVSTLPLKIRIAQSDIDRGEILRTRTTSIWARQSVRKRQLAQWLQNVTFVPIAAIHLDVTSIPMEIAGGPSSLRASSVKNHHARSIERRSFNECPTLGPL